MAGFKEKGTAVEAATPHYHGHRDRLKQRFRDRGGETLGDYELLELILFQVLPRQDTKPLAKKLLAKFGTFSEVLAASETELREIDDIGPAVVHHFR